MASDLERLQGTWQAVKITTAGGPLPPGSASRVRYVFEADRVTLLEGGRPSGSGTFTLRPDDVPPALEVEMDDGPARGQNAAGIYALDGDRLRICIGPDRPSSFDAVGTAACVELERHREA